ncbi:MAG: hypothetical protein IJL50_00945 [Bacteroidaceae bacterium]|nr:hypothetical protein [Bacteroidaceae bacterium]
MEKYDFIKLMLKNRKLSVNDKKRLILLATQEIEKVNNVAKESEINILDGDKSPQKEQVHAPKDTAAFLSLFNYENGFKFLTHDFDPNSEMEYDQLVNIAQKAFMSASRDYKIPASLYAFMRTVLFGEGKYKTWKDCNGKDHSENYVCAEWKQWAKNNPKLHILSNETIKNTIMDIRSTIRLVLSENTDSRLKTIIKRQEKKHANLSIISENLDYADEFYTYVNYLEQGIKLILDDMSKRFKESAKVKISYDSSRDGDYKLCIIRITQYGSFSPISLDEVQSKFKDGGGDFFRIKNALCGYCNWAVESKWGDKVMRWNILNDTGIEETEDLSSTDIPGFTHILTYYSKLK